MRHIPRGLCLWVLGMTMGSIPAPVWWPVILSAVKHRACSLTLEKVLQANLTILHKDHKRNCSAKKMPGLALTIQPSNRCQWISAGVKNPQQRPDPSSEPEQGRPEHGPWDEANFTRFFSSLDCPQEVRHAYLETVSFLMKHSTVIRNPRTSAPANAFLAALGNLEQTMPWSACTDPGLG